MAKKKIKYVCQECGAESARWLGKCPMCGKWNTLVEEVVEDIPVKTEHALTTAYEMPRRIAEVDLAELPRFSTGSGELDRVLGGGLIPGSIILIAGDPGVGKSSLTLATCAYIANMLRAKKVPAKFVCVPKDLTRLQTSFLFALKIILKELLNTSKKLNPNC